MLYKKPAGLKYTDFAIFIDEHVRDDDEKTRELCFEYMWHLFYVLAVKGKMFKNGRDYDEYALYGATQLFLRYQKEQDPVKGAKLKPIKSCLNYIKKVLYPLKVNYQKTSFNQVFQEGAFPEDNLPTQIRDDQVEIIRKQNNNLMSVEYEKYLEDICSTIKLVLKSSPYTSDKSTLHNIYLSCLLTLLKTTTMSNKNKARIKNKENRVLPVEALADQIYREESRDNIVVYHLDKSMENYIATLVNKIRKEVVKDLRYIIGSYEPSEQVIKDILISPLEEIVDKEAIQSNKE